MTIKRYKKTREEIRWKVEVKRSNAAQPHKNLTRYDRKVKHRDRSYD